MIFGFVRDFADGWQRCPKGTRAAASDRDTAGIRRPARKARFPEPVQSPEGR
jgi:hypothetical protein